MRGSDLIRREDVERVLREAKRTRPAYGGPGSVNRPAWMVLNEVVEEIRKLPAVARHIGPAEPVPAPSR